MANGHGGARPNSGRKTRPDPWLLTEGERVNLAVYCKEVGFDPVIEMIDMALDPETSKGARFTCCREIARYIHPTMTAARVEHSGKIEGDLSGKSAEELRKMVDELKGS